MWVWLNSSPDVDVNLAPYPIISVRLRRVYLNDREAESSIEPELASWYLQFTVLPAYIPGGAAFTG